MKHLTAALAALLTTAILVSPIAADDTSGISGIIATLAPVVLA
ncbi:hypothetical protein [Erythrobacter sp.]|jgi:hypothetical protein|nr:hypothetical protein [Erythrobacter sp.]